MPGQKKRTIKKTTRTQSRKHKAKKPKVTLSIRKVYLLSGIIVFLCAVSLVVSIVLSPQKPEQSEAPHQTEERVAKTPPPEQPSVVPTQQPNTTKPSTTKPPATPEPQPQKKSAQSEAVQKPAEPPAKAVASAKAEKPSQPHPTAQRAKPRESTEKKSPFAIPPAQNGATLVFVIDDAGRSVENVRQYTALPFPITIAVLPKLPQSRACADTITAMGKEAILHQPMQATNLNLDPGPGAIKGDMSTYQIADIIKENLAELGTGIKGMNNHEGSLITAHIVKIGAVLDVCNEMGLYFLDSRTTAETKAPQAALERDMQIFEKAGPYIDNDIDRTKMLERIYETLAYANRHGRAIVIGHVDKSVHILPALLRDLYPFLVQQGYRFATPSMLR